MRGGAGVLTGSAARRHVGCGGDGLAGGRGVRGNWVPGTTDYRRLPRGCPRQGTLLNLARFFFPLSFLGFPFLRVSSVTTVDKRGGVLGVGGWGGSLTRLASFSLGWAVVVDVGYGEGSEGTNGITRGRGT